MLDNGDFVPRLVLDEFSGNDLGVKVSEPSLSRVDLRFLRV